ncbi:MAG TPA: STAS domain-containing protein [Thermoanaerobaculia bacterium]|jgi:anti-sigma B factor antagonist|nr:STAS domain-containing protein [Thermoanaerobaculia bacterium]
MDLTLFEDGSVTIVTLSGDLVIGEAEALFKKTVNRLIEEGKVRLVVDCTGLRYVDSSGLGALVRALTTAQRDGGAAKLLGVPSSLRKLLELTRLDSVFEMFESREQAVSSF